MRAVILVTESNVLDNRSMKVKSQSEDLQIQIKVCYLICGASVLAKYFTYCTSVHN